MKWSLLSWQECCYQQAIEYPNTELLQKAVRELQNAPALVTVAEIKRLKCAIAKAGKGEAFILQGGDCAESFQDCKADIISNKLNILLKMSLILVNGMKKPIIKIGRIAGQYSKPRSLAYETINKVTLPAYRGDLINKSAFNAQSRRPNPKRLVQGYYYAAVTLNYIRALCSGFYTSHEAMHLYYEQALTRLDKGKWYDLSTHLPWIGMRTLDLKGAHVEFFRGISNPVGIKIGPHMDSDFLKDLLTCLNPHREKGKIVLITRFGSNRVDNILPTLIEAVRKLRHPVTWSCDPMHGNTETTEKGIKTRHFNNVLSELKQAIQIHYKMHSYLGGVHFELTGENVTECIGGAQKLSAQDLSQAYHSLVDPRLNYEQSLEMAVQLSHEFRRYLYGI